MDLTSLTNFPSIQTKAPIKTFIKTIKKDRKIHPKGKSAIRVTGPSKE